MEHDDHYAWLTGQIKLLKTGQMDALDVSGLIEELETLTKRQKRDNFRRLRLLVGHLLAWEFNPGARVDTWARTVRTQRQDLVHLITKNPSIEEAIRLQLADAYADALDLAAMETHLEIHQFPSRCPYSLEELLDHTFWPDHKI